MVEVKMLIKKVRLVRPVRFELTTFCSGGEDLRYVVDATGAIERLRGPKRACSALFDAPIFILKKAKCPRYISGSGTRLACETRNRPCTKEVLARMGSCQSRDLTTFLRVWAEVVITYLTNRLVWLTPLLGVTGYCLGCSPATTIGSGRPASRLYGCDFPRCEKRGRDDRHSFCD